MAETDTIYVRPTGSVSTCSECGQDVPPQWEVSRTRTGKSSDGPFDTRGEAIQDALDNRSDEAVVLLRSNGDVHSEVQPAVVAAEPGQAVDGGSTEE